MKHIKKSNKKNIISAIYAIINTTNNKIYIGSSSNCAKRFRHHQSELRNGNHHNLHLLNAYNKYGEDAFVYMILQKCPKKWTTKRLLQEEQIYINYYNSTNPNCGYNNQLKTDNSIISEETKERMMKNRKSSIITPKEKQQISKRLTGRVLTNEEKLQRSKTMKKRRKENPRTASPELKTKLSDVHKGYKNGEYCYTQYLEEWKTLKDTFMSYADISKKYNIASSTIERYLKNYDKIKEKMQTKKWTNINYSYIQYIDEWKKLHKQGMSYNKIRNLYKVSCITVIKYITNYEQIKEQSKHQNINPDLPPSPSPSSPSPTPTPP